MEKPIVFLSHSAKDKPQLVALKEILDKRAAGSLEFFLSSDGQSIRFGRNWVVRVSDALANAKLMFVFLSPESADSKWIHFEAGCAYANDIQVVPVCLPGVELSRITPPLGLLQGFNLHSHEALGNLARTCNETFALKIEETFTAADFAAAFGSSTAGRGGFFGNCSWAIHQVTLGLVRELPADEVFDPVPKLKEVATSTGTDCIGEEGVDHAGQRVRLLELPGCSVRSSQAVFTRHSQPPGPDQSPSRRKRVELHAVLSPEMFHLTAPLLDRWQAEAAIPGPWSARIVFNPEIGCEQAMHQLTTKLYKTDIRLVDRSKLDFAGLIFTLDQSGAWRLDFDCSGNLHDSRLPRLIDRLFELGVLFEREPPTDSIFSGPMFGVR